MLEAAWERSVSLIALAVCTDHGTDALHPMCLEDLGLERSPRGRPGVRAAGHTTAARAVLRHQRRRRVQWPRIAARPMTEERRKGHRELGPHTDAPLPVSPESAQEKTGPVKEKTAPPHTRRAGSIHENEQQIHRFGRRRRRAPFDSQCLFRSRVSRTAEVFRRCARPRRHNCNGSGGRWRGIATALGQRDERGSGQLALLPRLPDPGRLHR
jgi:hypothetical protein